jgi:hypothetical protein
LKLFDKIFFSLIFGGVLPVTLFLLGWWGTLSFVPENKIFIFAFSGFIIGIILDFFILRKAISNLYEINNSTLALIYIFYSICCLGFFMGVPIFNLLLGFPAGYYVAKRCIFLEREDVYTKNYFKQTTVFTVVIMFIVCIVSASIALTDPYTARDLTKMLGLNFEITKSMLVLTITIGGILLIVFQYYLTKFTALIVHQYSSEEIL